MGFSTSIASEEFHSSVGELAPTPELLSFYKQRIDDFEQEREEMLESVDRCAVQHQEYHKLEWENKKRAEEIRELQKALSDAHSYLFEERERLLKLQAENDELRLQEIEDRKRIQHLLALTQPVEQEITYFRDKKPESMVVYPKNNKQSSLPQGTRIPTQTNDENKPPKSNTGKQESVMRTVYLPAANTDALMMKVESLQAQLAEQKQFANERVTSLLEDRRIREYDEEAHRANNNQRVEQLNLKLSKTEKMLQQTTKDYIILRKAKQDAHARAVAASSALNTERLAYESKIKEIENENENKMDKLKAMTEAKTEEYVSQFREQVKQREEEIINLESVHTAVRTQYEKRISVLETKLVSLKQKYQQLEYRRTLDIEGFTNDVTNTRRQLASIDRKLHQMRLLERLDDDERLDTLLDQLQKKSPSLDSSFMTDEDLDDASSIHSDQPHMTSTRGQSLPKGQSNLASQLSQLWSHVDGLDKRLDQSKNHRV